jgi:predicted alpha/beta-hydrolase family hydrolase
MPTAGALLLTPGAGADREHRTLRALDDGLHLPVARVDFPYRIAGRRAPDRAPVAIAHLREEAAAFVAERRMRANRLVLGGRSYGGRMCSMAVAEGLPAAGLVLLSYPLHPPGKPDQLRIEHFAHIDVPCLFVSGRKDAFGSPEELEREVRAISGPVEVAWIDGGHDPKGQDARIVEIVGAWLRTLR